MHEIYQVVIQTFLVVNLKASTRQYVIKKHYLFEVRKVACKCSEHEIFRLCVSIKMFQLAWPIRSATVPINFI